MRQNPTTRSTDGDRPTLPNFLIVGAAKSGTTSLYQYFRQHPEIFMAEDKEPNYFVAGLIPDEQKANEISTFDEYRNLYVGSEGYSIRGDASPHNLYFHRVAIPEIQKCAGDIKIVISLRNPVDRAWSQYSSMLGTHRFEPFEDFLEFESQYPSPEATWADRNRLLRSWGLYYDQVKAYVDSFSNVEVVLYDDLRTDPLKTTKQLYRFLGVDDGFSPEVGASYNVSVVPRNRGIRALTNAYRHLDLGSLLTAVLSRVTDPERAVILKAKLLKNVAPMISTKPVMNEDTRAELEEFFRPEILRLQDLIQRDLSVWLQR